MFIKFPVISDIVLRTLCSISNTVINKQENK